MIRVGNLYKSYGSHEVLKGLNLHVERGEIYGFIGRNGAGKSTTMNILTGLIGFDGGSCIVNGADVKKFHYGDKISIGYLPEAPSIYSYMNAIEYLEYIGSTKDLTSIDIKRRIEELIDFVGLKESAKRRIGGYSRGMRQRIGLAAALFHNPEIVFLDEPSSALDPEGRREMLKLIQYLRDFGKTVFLSTHILSDVERVCHRVGILDRGRIVLEQPLQQLLQDFATPVFDVESDERIDDKSIISLKRFDWIKDINIDNESMQIITSKEDTPSKTVFQAVAALDIPVRSFLRRKSNLEDVFVKIVEQGKGGRYNENI